jgi:hypothetical protein
MYVLERESTLDQYGHESLAMLSNLLLLEVLLIKLLEVLKIVGA